jgi:hypothetical protein
MRLRSVFARGYGLVAVVMVLAVAVAGGGASSLAAGSEPLPRIGLPLGYTSELRVEPARMGFATSLCSPVFSKLVWESWGQTGARGHGQGLFPLLDSHAEDCYTAAKQARPEATRIVLSRPRECEGETVFTRIGWKARGVHRHLILECVPLVGG